MNKGIILKAVIIAFLLSLIAMQADALDYPHNGSIDCNSCHYVFGSEPSLILENLQEGPSIDDTKYNWLCWGCHTESGSAPYVKTHSSITLDNGYGDWTIECRACHDPHGHYQFRTFGSSAYVEQGAVSSVDSATLTKTGAGWVDDQYAGYILIPNTLIDWFNYQITGNDSDTLTVNGSIDLAQVNPGDTFAIAYGRLVKSTLATPNSGNKAVKFFDVTGVNSFADGDATHDGVCEVCHTQTTHHRNDGLGPSQSHNDGTDCASCHDHTKGFKVACNTCHGFPPTVDNPPGPLGGPDGLVNDPGVTNSTTAGAHDLHYTTKGYDCDVCHFNSAGTGAAHNSGLTVTMGFNYFSGAEQGGSYDGQSGVNYDITATTPATSVTNTGALTCSNIYCHGSTMDPNGGTDITPVWNNSSTGACGTCHGATAASPPSLGSHTIHAGDSNLNVACTVCHDGYTAVHVNNEANITFSSDARVNGGSYSGTTTMLDAYGSCSSIYCHGSGPSPDWDDIGSLNCGSCHSANNANLPDSHPAHYDSLSTATASDRTATNYSTASNYIFTCGVCHDSTTHAGGPVSANQAAEISFDSGIAGSGTHTPGALAGNDNGFNYTSGTCSSTYCHSDGNGGAGNVDPQWGVTTVDCSSCHNNDVSSGSPMATGSHTTHINDTDNEAGRDLGCIECHADTVSDNTTIANYANHVNKSKDIKVNIDDTGCSNIQCHSDGNFDGTVSYNNPAWGVDTLGCVNCHGNSTDQAYPSYADGGLGTGASNTHNKHVGSEGISCGECHADTSTDGTTIDGSTPTKHVDQTVDVVLQTGTYTGGTETCSSTYCHGTGTPQWGGASFNCDECHKANNTLAGAHSKHYESATAATDRTSGNNSSSSEYIFNCGVCHNSTDHAGGAVSANQAAEISFDTAIAGASAAHTPGALAGSDNGFNYTDAACSSTYCHGNFPGSGETSNAPTWNNTASGDCGTCHNAKNTQAEAITSGSHARHVGDGSGQYVGSWLMKNKEHECTLCHDGIIGGTGPAGYTIADSSEHVDTNVDWAFDASSSQLSKYSGVGGVNNYSIGSGSQSPSDGSRAYGSCTVYCHSIVQTSTGGPLTGANGEFDTDGTGNPLRKWGEVTGCYGCHTDTATYSDSNDYSQIKNRHERISSGSHQKHLYNFVNLPDAGGQLCLACHNWNDNPDVEVNLISCYSGRCHNTTGEKTKHIDGNIDLTFRGKFVLTGVQVDSGGAASSYSGGTVPGDNSYGQCSNVYCHSDGTAQRTGNYAYSNTTPQWGSSGPLACNTCHGNATEAAPNNAMPDYANNSIKENSHRIHAVDNSILCEYCHYLTLGNTESSTTIEQPINHANGRYNVGWGGLDYFNGIQISFTYSTEASTSSIGSCSNISCHGGNSATWGATLSCDDCHFSTADDDSLGSTANDGKIAKINSTEWTSTGHGQAGATLGCEYCHKSTVDHNTGTNPFRLIDNHGGGNGWNDVCLICHETGSTGYNPGGGNIDSSMDVDKYHQMTAHTQSGNNGGKFCFDCHDPHGDSNIMMIQDRPAKTTDGTYGIPQTIPSVDVVFSDNAVATGAGGFAITSGTFEEGICNTCHTVSASSPKMQHYASSSSDGSHNTGTVCTTCHDHSGDTTVNGQAFEGSGNCDSCHAYPPAVGDGKAYMKVNGSPPTAEEGKGTHVAHVNHIEALYIAGGGSALDPNNDTFGDAKTTAICGVCHDMSVGNHDTDGNGTRIINFNNSTAYQFGPSTPNYNGVIGTAGSTTAKTCSSVSCHFKITPQWEAY